MNRRLQQLYSSMVESSRDRFLTNDLDLDTQWRNPVWGIVLQIDLSDSVRDQLCCYQEELNKLESNNLLLLPRLYQHLSFNQVIFWGGEYSLGSEATWNKISADFLAKFNKLDSQYSSFIIKFSQLIITTGGIIWAAFDENDELETLRNEFLNVLPFPPETTKQNHIIHTTVARFKNKLANPQKVLTYIENQHQVSEMTINKIILRKEFVFPSIKTETIAQIELK